MHTLSSTLSGLLSRELTHFTVCSVLPNINIFDYSSAVFWFVFLNISI